MSWPLSQDYNEAIQSPRTSFSDPELRQGEPALNALGLPLPRSGNFADVYEVTCPGGAKWAVKCFTRQVADQRERYAEISRHLQDVRLPFAVAFQYLDEGIRVRGRWYPVLKMRWVEGLLLNEFVGNNVDRPALLEALSQIWARMARRLREGRLAHGDLQHGNVLLVPGSKNASLALKLIDYDGMFVPALAWKSAGEVGHPNFQHPARATERAYNLKIDRFPLLLVAAALRALTVGGRPLWERYDNGDNLLFKESDLRAPAESPLFAELRRLPDPLAQSLAGQLQRACAGRLEDVPFVGDLLPEEKAAPARAPAPAGAVTASSPIAVAPLAVVEQEAPDWDFGAPSAVVSLRKPRGGVPPWAWALGGAGAMALLVGVVGAGAAAFFLTRKSPPPANNAPVAVAQADPKPEAAPPERPPKPGAKQPAPDGPGPEPDRGEAPPMPPPAPVVPAPPPPRPPRRRPVLPPPAQPPAPAPTLVREFPGHSGLDTQLALSPDGKLLLSSTEVGQIRLFEVETGAQRREMVGHTASPGRVSVAFLSAQRAVSAGADKMLHVWDLTTGKPVSSAAQPRPVLRLAVSPNGRRLVICGQGDAVVLVSDVKTRLVTHRLPGHSKGCSVAAFTPDGKRLVTADVGGTLHLWDLARTRPEVRNFRVSSLCPYSAKVTPDGRSALVGDQGGTVGLYDLATGRSLRQMATGGKTPAYAADVSPDGRLALVGGLNAVHVCELATGKEFYRCPGHNWVSAAAFLPDGRRLVSSDRTAVRLWRLPDEKSEVARAPAATSPKLAGPPGRLPVPDADAVAAAEKEVRQADEADLAPADPAALQRVADKWIQRAGNGREEPATRYALLRAARDVALRAENIFQVQRATDEIVKLFAVSPLGERLAAAEAAVATLGANKGWKVFPWVLDVMEEARGADEYDLAMRAAAAARAAVAKGPAQNREWVERAVRQVEAQRGAFEKVRKEVDALAARPDDPAANAAVGRFWCYQKGDWDGGLPLLARGGDADLAALARQDLAGPADAAAQARLGDLWWERAGKEGEDRAGPQRRARFWYLRALPRLGGEARERAAERSKVVVGAWQGSPGWVAEFFADSDRTKKAKSRVEYVLAVPGDGVPPGVKAVRWAGWLWPAGQGNYSLIVQPGAGTEFRFYQNGRALMGGPSGEYKEGEWLKGTWNIGMHLGDKPHQVRLECRNVAGPLTVTVSMHRNGGPRSARTALAEALYYDAEQAKALGQGQRSEVRSQRSEVRGQESGGLWF